jgi:peptide subunit release factor 1 (eRF1)
MDTEILQRLSQYASDGKVLSLYLDMSVNSDNKRTYQTFLNKQRSRFPELDSDRSAHHREALGATLDRIEQWLQTEFDTRCKGAAIFAEPGGELFEAISFKRPFQNRLELSDQPLMGPLRIAHGNERRHCVAVVDREHLRLLSIYMDEIEEEKVVEPEAYPMPHDVQAGGYAHKDYQKWKAEETRKFFKMFADDVQKFGDMRRTDGYVLLGTDENVKKFREFLPQSVTDRIVHTGHAVPGGNGSDIVRQLAQVFADITAREEARAIDELLGRVRQEHLATTGWHETLKELQEGKVDQLFIASNESKDGVQCTQCRFYLVRRDGECPYCGGELRDGVDLVESAVRMASGQDVRLAFVAGDLMNELDGVGALLKFR